MNCLCLLQLAVVSDAGRPIRECRCDYRQAEASLNRNTLPRLAGPEVERVMRMLVADIDLFVRASDSHIFATKEHVILGGNGYVRYPACSMPIDSLDVD